MANKVSDFVIASGGTDSSGVAGGGHRLMGLYIPTVTSCSFTFEWSRDGSTNWTTVKDLDGTTPAAISLGGADTGGKVVAVPDTVSKLSATGHLRLVASDAQGAERTIRGIYERLF